MSVIISEAQYPSQEQPLEFVPLTPPHQTRAGLEGTVVLNDPSRKAVSENPNVREFDPLGDLLRAFATPALSFFNSIGINLTNADIERITKDFGVITPIGNDLSNYHRPHELNPDSQSAYNTNPELGIVA